MEKIDKKAVGARIMTIRLASGMTLKEFGQLFGASKGSVQGWEYGRNTPNPERLKKIAEFANISVQDLLHEVKRYMYVITHSDYSGLIVQTKIYAKLYTSLEAAERAVVRYKYEQGVPVDQDHRFSIEKMEVVE